MAFGPPEITTAEITEPAPTQQLPAPLPLTCCVAAASCTGKAGGLCAHLFQVAPWPLKHAPDLLLLRLLHSFPGQLAVGFTMPTILTTKDNSAWN